MSKIKGDVNEKLFALALKRREQVLIPRPPKVKPQSGITLETAVNLAKRGSQL